MAAAPIRFHPAAVQEAESTYDWYAARDLAAAHGFAKNYGRPSTRLLQTLVPGRVTVAVFPRYPFSLVYIRRGDGIEVVAVAHGRRRPGYWRLRL